MFVGDAGTTEAGRQPAVRRGVGQLLQPAAVAHARRRPVVVFGSFHGRRPVGIGDFRRDSDRASVGTSIRELPAILRRIAPALSWSASTHRGRQLALKSRRSLLINMEIGLQGRPASAALPAGVLTLFGSTRDSDIDYYYVSRLAGEPVEGVDDIHTHPVQPRTARIGVQLDF